MIRFLFGLFTLLVLVAGAILLLLENPDRFKPQITAAAEAATGYRMQIDGELSWRYWPPIAINAENVSLSTPDRSPFAVIDTMSIDVDLIPLLMQQSVINVNEVLLSGGTVTLEVDAEGRGNWTVEADAATSDTGETTEDAPALQASIEQFAIDGLQVAYRNQQDGTDTRVAINRLVTSALATDRPFDVSADLVIEDLAASIEAEVSATGQLLYKSDSDNINFNDLVLSIIATVDGERYPPASITTTGEWRAADQHLVLNQNAISISAVNLTSKGVVFMGGSAPRYDGAVVMEIADPARLARDLDVSLPVAFLQVKTDLTLTPDTLELLTMEGSFDDSTFTGTGHLTTSDAFYLKSELRIDRLDADRYLADETGPPTDTELIPYTELRDRKMDIILRFGELQYAGDTFNATKTEIKNIGWRLDTSTNTEAFDGKLLMNTTSLLKKDGETKFWLSMDSLDLQSILDEPSITGRLFGNSRLSFNGNRMSDLTQTLDGKTTFRVEDGSLDVRPIKNLVATIDALRGKQSPISQWPDVMPFKRMMGQHVFSKGTRQGQLLNAELENIAFMAVGGFDLTTETLAYEVSTLFNEAKEGQFNVGRELTGVRWPMTCEGSFSDTPADLCFGKEGAINELVANLVRQEIKRRGNEKLQEVLGDKVPEEYRELTDELFKNLFK